MPEDDESNGVNVNSNKLVSQIKFLEDHKASIEFSSLVYTIDPAQTKSYITLIRSKNLAVEVTVM